MKTHRAAFGLTLAIGLSTSPFGKAQDAGKINERASEQSFEQQAIRADIVSLHERLKAIRQELAQNGAPPADLAPIDQALAKLETVSEKKMQEVIASLRNAGSANNPAAVQAALLSAYADQGEVIGAMLSFSQDVRVPRTLVEMREQTRRLLLRQTANLRETAALRNLAPPKERWKEEDRTRQAIVSTAQEILGQEIVGLAESVRQTASDPERPDSRALASCAEVVTRWNLAGETRTAAQAAATAAWTVALPSQEKLRSALQEILFSFQAAMSVEDSLQAAVKDLTDLADAQRDLASHSESGQERKQETLQDAAAVLEKTLLGLNLPASQKTSTAKDLMEQATKAIAKKSPESSALQEKAASTLDEAKKDLETQIAALSETSTPQTPQERLEALAKLHDEVMKQKTEADTMAANPNAARDAAKALSKDVAKTQQEALGVSPAAAQPLGSAASQLGMEDASASKKAADASPKLAEAASALQKEMDQVRGAMENARQMAQAESALDTAVLQTALGARSTEGESANLEDAAGRFEDASRRLEGIQQSPNLPSDVAGALKAAQEALDAAKQAAEQGGAKGGKDNAAKAQQAMAQAKEAMGQAAGGMPQGGMMAGGKGKPGPPSRSKGGGGKLAGAEPMPDQLIGSGADTQRNAGVVVGALKPGERAAIRQSAQENVPSEYTALVRQYMKNLADEGASK